MSRSERIYQRARPSHCENELCAHPNCTCDELLYAAEKAQEPTANDYQVGGSHYANKVVQPWDAMEAWMSPEQFAGFLRGNAIKYVARYQDKGGKEDIRKAIHYLEKLLEVMR